MSELFTHINVILCAELMVNYQEDLKDTRLYKHSVKKKSKDLQEELEKMLKNEFPGLYQADEQFVVNLMQSMKSMVDSVSSFGPDDIIVVSQLLEEYSRDKEKFLSIHDIKINTLDLT